MHFVKLPKNRNLSDDARGKSIMSEPSNITLSMESWTYDKLVSSLEEHKQDSESDFLALELVHEASKTSDVGYTPFDEETPTMNLNWEDVRWDPKNYRDVKRLLMRMKRAGDYCVSRVNPDDSVEILDGFQGYSNIVSYEPNMLRPSDLLDESKMGENVEKISRTFEQMGLSADEAEHSLALLGKEVLSHLPSKAEDAEEHSEAYYLQMPKAIKCATLSAPRYDVAVSGAIIAAAFSQKGLTKEQAKSSLRELRHKVTLEMAPKALESQR